MTLIRIWKCIFNEVRHYVQTNFEKLRVKRSNRTLLNVLEARNQPLKITLLRDSLVSWDISLLYFLIAFYLSSLFFRLILSNINKNFCTIQIICNDIGFRYFRYLPCWATCQLKMKNLCKGKAVHITCMQAFLPFLLTFYPYILLILALLTSASKVVSS